MSDLKVNNLVMLPKRADELLDKLNELISAHNALVDAAMGVPERYLQVEQDVPSTDGKELPS